MSRRNSRPLIAIAAILLFAALWLGSPASAAPLPVTQSTAQPAGPLIGLLDWFEGLLGYLIPPPPDVPGERQGPMDSTKPIDDGNSGGGRGGTIDPNGGSTTGIEHMVVYL